MRPMRKSNMKRILSFIRSILTSLHNSMSDEMISDGFGNQVFKYCEYCGKPTMQVVRPGKFQCSNCDKE